jgi:hypothetical protein
MKLVKSEAFIYQPWLKPFILMSTPGYYGYNMVLIITMVIFNIYIYISFFMLFFGQFLGRICLKLEPRWWCPFWRQRWPPWPRIGNQDVLWCCGADGS